MSWIWVAWSSGFAVHLLTTPEINRKQAAVVLAVQYTTGLLLEQFGEQLGISGSIVLVNVFHVITTWLVQYIKRQELQKLKREITQKCATLFQ